MTAPPLIGTRGDRLVDAAGSPVVLAGVGLGGWMTMENFITGFPATESQMRRALRRTLGPEACEAFFDQFLHDFLADADAELLAALGVNCVRVPFSYVHLEDDHRPFLVKESGLRWLDRAVTVLGDHGIATILDLHAAPGHQNQHWHSDNPTHWADFWNHPHFQDRVVHLWEVLAERYRDDPRVAGYNLLNEPSDASGEAIGPFYTRLEKAIRAVDPHHVLFLDGNRYSTDFSAFGEPFENTVYTAHDYALPGIARGSEYPGLSRGTYVDRGVVAKTFLRRTEYMRRTGTPIWVGEFGPIYTGDPDIDAARYRLLQDQLDIYREHHASWSLWTYKDIGLQGLVHARPDSPYLRQIADVLAKKQRLGADSWGGDDTHVRHLLDPIEELFATEFPDYDPYPWGAKPWIGTLVRNILIAEPLVQDFARAFDGVNTERARELASSFALGQCTRRDALTDLLAAHLATLPEVRPLVRAAPAHG